MCPMTSLLLLPLVAVTMTTVCGHNVMTNEQLTHENARLDKKVETLEEERIKLTLGLEQLGDKLTKKMDTITEKMDKLTEDKVNLAEEVRQLTKTSKAQNEKIERLTEDKLRLVDHLDRLFSQIDLNGTVNGRYETESKPKSCVEAKKFDTTSGVHTLNVNGYDVTAYCDQTTSGGGWTVIQRRETGDIDFYREWDAYLRGFGNPVSEYWLGLENIHQMTKTRNYKLRVDLTAFDGTTAYAEYDQFYVDAADRKYTLHVRGYSGTAGDALGYHNTRPFSTYDRDNDALSENCATEHHGGWWYNACHSSNLNGPYRPSAVAEPDGVVWLAWKNSFIALEKAEMKVKPAV